MPTSEDHPKWDVALASLALDEQRRKTTPLTLEDFGRLASEYRIRLDDIMETMFLLVIHGQWEYLDASGKAQALDRQTLDRLYVKGRLAADDLAAFDGGWRPLR
ncbi:MAG TPA: hypothetical protein ENK05_07430 [Gammaproteobacteria bacterium]|nr:hypothetical protein [Gammaproteobacteria bacterium]